LKKLLALALLCVGASVLASAQVQGVPEIDPASGASAIALIAGALIVIRGRRKN
jgi:hypothetical protein